MDLAEVDKNEPLRDKAIKLFTYLYELAGLRARMIRSVEEYDEAIWFSDFRELPGCYCVAFSPPSERGEQDDSSDIWIEIQKPKLSSPPDPLETLRDWLDPDEVADPFIERPNLIENGDSDPEDETTALEEEQGNYETIYSEPPPAIIQLWEEYIENQWTPWALSEQPYRRVQEVYGRLFSIHQKQQQLGERYQVVVGFGLLSWGISQAEKVRRHLVVAQANIEFDIAAGVIRVTAAAEGANPVLEQDMLEPDRRPGQDIQKRLEKEASALGDDFWFTSNLNELLAAYSNALQANGRYDQSLTPESRTLSEPLVQFAPAVILRRRGERTFQLAFKRIQDQLEIGQEIPAGVELLLRIAEEEGLPELHPVTENEPLMGTSSVSEVLFPLPANHEQLAVIEGLSLQRGVVVQGPPGTGKSHTIANILCHLLANGKRVLVTSHTSRALEVLHEKIPAEIASLCVSLLGNDRASQQALEDSVNGITKRHNSWQATKNFQGIYEAKKDLEIARREEAAIFKELRRIREQEIDDHTSRFGDYGGTAKEIALLLREREPAHSWIGIRPDPDDVPPLTNAEAKELLDLARKLTPDIEEQLAKASISPDGLIAPKHFSKLVNQESSLKRSHTALQGARDLQGYRSLISLADNHRESLMQELSAHRKSYLAIVTNSMAWVETAAQEIIAGRGRRWWEILEKSSKYLSEAKPLLPKVESLKVSGFAPRDSGKVRRDADVLLSHLKAGGKLRRFLITPKIVRERKYLIDVVRVNRRPASDPQTLQALVIYIDLFDLVDSLHRVWGDLAPNRNTTFGNQHAEFQDLHESLRAALDLQTSADSIRRLFEVAEDFPQPLLHDMSQVEALEHSVQAAYVEVKLKNIIATMKMESAKFADLIGGPNVHPTLLVTHAAIVDRNPERYADAYYRLTQLESFRKEAAKRDHLSSKLRMTLPGIADELIAAPDDQNWDDRVGQIEDAWRWA